jgi:hypothetical protein
MRRQAQELEDLAIGDLGIAEEILAPQDHGPALAGSGGTTPPAVRRSDSRRVGVVAVRVARGAGLGDQPLGFATEPFGFGVDRGLEAAQFLEPSVDLVLIVR